MCVFAAINPFVPNAFILYPLKTPENTKNNYMFYIEGYVCQVSRN